MSSVTDIVNMISYVLVAFVAISLVVSSIMIGVITYISVLERKKEIGILRSIGASKGDISRVFNAETVIVGFTAGVIGIGVTALACIPANAIVYSLFDVANVASLPWQAGRHPGRHQRVPHVPGRPHPLERRQPQGPRGSAAKRVEPCTRTMPQAPPRPPTPPAPAARMRPAAPSARAQSGAPHCWWQTTNRTSSTCCANTSKGPASTRRPPPAANRRWQRRRTTPTWCFWT